VLFCVYYIGSLTFEILLFLMFAKDSTLHTKLTFTVLFIVIFGNVVLINVLCTQVNTYVYKCHSIMNSYICAKNTRISVKNRLKMQSFLERVSAKDIGFYCYDMFLMNNNEFKDYVAYFICNHILLVNLLS